MRSSAIDHRSLRGLGVGAVLGIVLLFLLPTASFAAPSTPRALPPIGGFHAAPPSVGSFAGNPKAGGASSGAGARLAPPSPPPLGPPPSSGRGTFFSNTQFPLPPLSNISCLRSYAGPVCVNITNEPSINYTSQGVLAIAYNALTNDSPCGNVSNLTTSLIGFRVSFTQGSTWSNPRYLGNPNCSVARNFPNALEPSLTSLSNGTLVLAYLEYNNTSGGATGYPAYPPYFNFFDLWNDRLVVSESYDNGTIWTSPTVLNASVNLQANTSAYTQNPSNPPDRPWITAHGQSVYVVWMNSTDPSTWIYPTHAYRSIVHLIASNDGGRTWGPQRDLKSWWGSYFGYAATDYSINPMVITDPSGEVFVGYASGFDYSATTYCEPYPPYYCLNYEPLVRLVLASSTNNGSSFNYTSVVSETPVTYYSGSYVDPAPQLAYSARYHELYYAYTSGLIGDFCYSFGCYESTTPDVFVANSSNLGASWSTPHPVAPSLLDPSHGPFSEVYNPAMVVDAAGTLHLEFSFVNGSLCYLGSCDVQFEMYENSTTNGSSWTLPILLSGNATYYPFSWDGEYVSMATDGAHFWAAYTLDLCPGYATAACYYPSTGGICDVTVGELYQGTGLTITFRESNLSKNTVWSAQLLGNERQGSAGAGPSTLSISGVPAGQPMFWSVPWVNLSYGVAEVPALSAAGPGAFTSSATIYANFSEFERLAISTAPSLPPYIFTGGVYQTTISISPNPGVFWEPLNHSFSAWVNQTGSKCGTGLCLFYNLTFLSWTGQGASSVSTSNNSVSGPMGSAVNETANFRFNSYCEYDPPYFSYCYNTTTFNLEFNETGLPTGTPWAVTIDGNITSTSSTDNLTFAVGAAPIPYVAWTVPDPGTGLDWVPTASVPSPVLLPQSPVVTLHYALVNVSSRLFALNFTESGLPNLTAWSLSVGNLSYGASGPSLVLSEPGGVSAPLNGSFVYLNNGSGFYVAKLSITEFVMNESSPTTVAVPAAPRFDGSALIVLEYAPMFRLTVEATAGGNVTGPSSWVALGGAETLLATASGGHHFVGWTGSGAGAKSLNTSSITVSPRGPVTEVAQFRPNLPATYNVTIQARGLPAGTGFPFELGSVSYTSPGSLDVPGLLAGTYPFSVGYAYLNDSNQTRYVPASWSSSFPTHGANVTIGANGTILVNFSTQYVLSVASSGPGSVSPSPGAYWESAGAQVTITATPSGHFAVGGVNGSGNGSTIAGPGVGVQPKVLEITMNGPIRETAWFVYHLFPIPATYHLTVNESGLPPGLSWNASVGTLAAGGAGNLEIDGLNGSYTLTVPPVYGAPGVRYVADLSGTKSLGENVSSNASVVIAFQEEFLLSIATSSGGSVGPLSAWELPGASVTLSASPSDGEQFVGWSGSGSGSYSGANPGATVTFQGPVSESATFSPTVAASGGGGSSSAGALTDLGLLALLLVVGLAIGIVVGRRGRLPAEKPIWSEDGESENPIAPDDPVPS